MPRRWAAPSRSDGDALTRNDAAGRPATLNAVRHPAFRRFMVSQIFNNLCLWTHRTAHIWLTVVVTGGDPFAVGLVTALQYLPMMLSAFGGSLGDRWQKRQVLLTSQAIAVIGSVVLAMLSITDTATLPLLCLMAVALGLTAAVDAPLRLALPREIVEPVSVKSAIALNGIVFQTARVVGPAVAGVVIVHWNESAGLLVASGCGVVALLVLLTVSTTGPIETAEDTGDGRWRATLRAIRRDPALASPLYGALLVGACLSDLQVALPLILDRMPGAGAAGFGLVVAVFGLGGAGGALTASAVWRGQSLRALNVFLVLFACATLVTAVLPTLVLMAIAIFIAGLVMQLYNTNAITTLQDASPAGQHGRVMGIYVVAYFVWAGFGTPLFGLAADAFGPREMLAVSSAACAVGGALLLRARSAGGRSSTALPSISTY